MPISETLFGKSGQFQQAQRFTPEQQQAFSQLLSQALSGLGSLQQQPLGQFDFGPIEQAEKSRFAQETIPGVAEQFTGTGGALSSPAFASQLGAAGATLGERLAALRSGSQLQQQQLGLQQRGLQHGLLQNLLNIGLTPQFEQTYLPGTTGLLGPLLGGLSGGLGQLGAAGLTNLFGR